MYAYSDRAIVALCLKFALFRLCESSRKYNPYFSISLSLGRFHASHLKIEERGGGFCRVQRRVATELRLWAALTVSILPWVDSIWRKFVIP